MTEAVTEPRGNEKEDSVGETSENTNVQTGAGKITGFVLESSSECYVKRFRAKGTRYVIRAKPIPGNENIVQWIEKLMRNLYEHLVAQSSSENDFLGISVNSDHFFKGVGGLSLRPIKDFSVKI